MKISPKKGYILASNYELPKEKKGILILEDNTPNKYMIVETDGEIYSHLDIIFPSPYKPKIQIDDNLFLIAEEDILASVDVSKN